MYTLALVVLAQRAEAARGFERLIGDSVERGFLAFRKRWYIVQRTFEDFLEGLAIFVDDPVGALGQFVV